MLYAVFGGIWIAVSDRALEALVADAHAISVIQSYKGEGFVALSALLIYAVVRREFGARERAEAALASSEERYLTLVELANDAIIVRTPDGRVMAWNAAAEATRSEVVRCRSFVASCRQSPAGS